MKKKIQVKEIEEESLKNIQTGEKEQRQMKRWKKCG